jgi:protoheme IX farnesyltransferase
VTAEPLTASEASPPRSFAALASDFVTMTKPRLSLQVLITAAGGLWFAGGSATSDPRTWILTLLGTAGTVAAANTLNCVFERESDRFMARTAQRPLPQGRISAPAAVMFAALCTGISLPMLWWVNPLTCSLGLLALLSYVFVYTPLKPRTHWAMQVGALPGALPPLMGWTAATNEIAAGGLSLFAILFCWELPHFIAIALFRAREYRAAGLRTVVSELGEDTARRHAVIYAVLQGLAAVSPYFAGLAAAAAIALWHFTLIRDRSRDGCFRAFRLNHWLGFVVFAGTAAAFALA